MLILPGDDFINLVNCLFFLSCKTSKHNISGILLSGSGLKANALAIEEPKFL